MKNNKNQLVFNFTEAVVQFRTASKNMVSAFEELNASSAPFPVKRASSKVLNDEVEIVRARINKVVRSKARTLNLRWNEVYRIIYERLRKKTNFDAIAKGLSKGIRPIDAVCQSGYGQELLELATDI